jgi:hypothetical protein
MLPDFLQALNIVGDEENPAIGYELAAWRPRDYD